VATSAPAAPAPARIGDYAGPEIWAYHAYWMGDAWRVYDLAAFRRILFFDLVAGADGSLGERHGWPGQWDDLRRRAAEARVPVDPVVSVIGKSAFSAIFASRDARARLAGEIVALARDSGGVHLDIEVFEPVRFEELRAFREFLAQLRAALDAPPRKVLTAFVATASGLYAAEELRHLDAVVVQGYDVHWREGPNAGPVAALDAGSPAAWRPAAETLVRQGVPPARIVFSTPLYGYEWPTVSAEARAATRGPGSIVTYAPLPPSLLPDLRVSALARAADHGLRREAASGTPWYAFNDGGGWRQGWFDDAASLKPRLDFVRAGGYRGVALFVLGYDGGMLLESIQSRFREAAPRASASSRPAAQ
jgi:spore germination protein YaaH